MALAWLTGKESACQCRRHRLDPWVRVITRRRKWQPTLVFLPAKSHGQRSPLGYSPWGRKESDITEHACLHGIWHTVGAQQAVVPFVLASLPVLI